MQGRLRIMIGVATVLLFAGIGGTMVSEGQTAVGWLIVGLAGFRAYVLVKQIRSLGDDHDDVRPPELD